jgi:hypothetical protein
MNRVEVAAYHAERAAPAARPRHVDLDASLADFAAHENPAAIGGKYDAGAPVRGPVGQAAVGLDDQTRDHACGNALVLEPEPEPERVLGPDPVVRL